MATVNGNGTPPARWVGLGNSSDPDASKAGREATAQALEAGPAKCLIVFASPDYDLDELTGSIHRSAEGAEVVGCSTAGEIATNGPGDASVVVLALGGEGLSVATAAAGEASSRLRDAGAEAAACLSRVEDRPYRVLMLLTDGLAGDQQEIVRGAYSVVGASVPLVGGCAGDNLEMRETLQLYGDQVLRDAVIGIGIASDSPLGIGVRHGWREVGEPMLVTESSATRVYTLDDRPALDVYLERLEAPEDARTDPAAFTRFAMTHPFGVSTRAAETQIRYIADANFDDRSIGCIAEVPQGGLTWLMEGDSGSVLDATDAACADALGALDGHRPLGVVAFDCIARRGVLGEEGIKREIERIGQRVDGVPVAGFYTYGEIARTRGIAGFHNQTLVVLALS
jgi:hypothetical protein